MAGTLKISRAQLAAFLKNDHDAIRQFETLFDIAAPLEAVPIAADELSAASSIADDKAQKALVAIYGLQDSLDRLASAPIADAGNAVHRSGTELVRGNKTFFDQTLVGESASLADFPNAGLISSRGDSGHSYSNNIGVVGESKSVVGFPGIGVGGVAQTNGIFPAYGMAGRALVSAGADSGAAIGVEGLSEAVHAGGSNISFYAIASGGLLNFSFYGNSGRIYNADTTTSTSKTTGSAVFGGGLAANGPFFAESGTFVKSDATAVIKLDRVDTTIGTDDIVGRLEVEGHDAGASGICATFEAIAEGNAGETGWRWCNGTAGAITETMRLNELGYLGIGTAEPDANLHVEYATGAVERLTRKDTTVTAGDIVGRVEFETQDAGSAGIGAYVQAVGGGSGGEVNVAIGTGLGGAAADRLVIDYAGVSTFSHRVLNPKMFITEEGGFAIRLVAGENLSRGEVVYVRIAGGTDGKVWKNPIDGDMPVGVVFANALADAEAVVVISGIAYVLPTSTVTATRGYVIYSSASEAGRVDQAAAVPAITTHMRECGHLLDTGGGNGVLTRAIIHFN